MKDDAGVTLIEVLVAAMLIGLALAPLMQLYPGILAADQESDLEMRVGMWSVRKMEEIIAELRDDIGAVVSGAETCDPLDPAYFPGCRVEWTIGVGELVMVGVRACADANGNSVCDSGEVQVRFDAKVASRPPQ